MAGLEQVERGRDTLERAAGKWTRVGLWGKVTPLDRKVS